MLKRILVALDREIVTPTAIKYSIKLAEKYDASLSGLAVVDLEAIGDTVGGGGIGTIQYAKELREKLTEESRKAAEKQLNNFKSMVEDSGVNHSNFMHEGVPHERIIEDSKYHDLLVVGRETHFFYNRPKMETKTLANIVKKGAGPTLMVTDSYRPIRRAVIAHDGSKASAYAMQWFVQLEPFGRNIEVDLVYACNQKKKEATEKANRIMNQAHDFLKAHGYENVNQLLLDKKGGAGKHIIHHVKDTDADLIVLGAHSVSAIRRLTFGSVTHELVKNSPVPLFLSS